MSELITYASYFAAFCGGILFTRLFDLVKGSFSGDAADTDYWK